ncbi:hypothetical protein M8J76_009733 [Diaphorina citri]|nr:hypothetical protein M8J75_006409 [Diaphorina citri]KAI5737062.1 hypothetical protein M8J76_009733 [Diaphorina citri]
MIQDLDDLTNRPLSRLGAEANHHPTQNPKALGNLRPPCIPSTSLASIKNTKSGEQYVHTCTASPAATH